MTVAEDKPWWREGRVSFHGPGYLHKGPATIDRSCGCKSHKRLPGNRSQKGPDVGPNDELVAVPHLFAIGHQDDMQAGLWGRLDIENL
jgi:hypothetical protein